MKIYDGAGMILGRLATVVAKEALLGEEVRVVNCDKVIISGKKVNTFAVHKQRRDRRGYPLKSPKIVRLSDRFVRRSIRGMLPHTQARGKEAFKRIMCYRTIPDELSDKDIIKLEGISLTKLPNLRYTTIQQICLQLGGKEHTQ